MAKFEFFIKQKRNFYPKQVPKKFYVERLLTDPECRNEFQIKIGGRFEALLDLDTDEMNVDELYNRFKEITNDTTKETVGFHKKKLVENMPPDLKKQCEQRRAARLQTLSHPNDLCCRNNYQTINRNVKKAVKECKANILKEIIHQPIEYD